MELEPLIITATKTNDHLSPYEISSKIPKPEDLIERLLFEHLLAPIELIAIKAYNLHESGYLSRKKVGEDEIGREIHGYKWTGNFWVPEIKTKKTYFPIFLNPHPASN